MENEWTREIERLQAENEKLREVLKNATTTLEYWFDCQADPATLAQKAAYAISLVRKAHES